MPTGEDNSQDIRRQLLRREREVEAARRISQVLSQHISVNELVETALRTALDVVGAKTGSVLLANPDSKELVFRHSMGEKPVEPGTAIPWDQGIAGAVFHSGKPMVVGDTTQDTRHFVGIDQATGHTTRDMITLPLKQWEGTPIGVLNVLNKRDGRLDEDDLAILTIISAIAAAAIEQARLFEEARLAEVVHRLGDLSHDVKNLLMPVVTGAGLLKSEIDDLFKSLPKKQVAKAKPGHDMCHEVLAMLKDAAGRIQDRMKEIADCVKGLSAPPQFAPCWVTGVVDTVLKTLGLVAMEKGLTLRTDGLDDLPMLMADERRLYNMFYNLINNAIPEVPKGGSITIRGQRALEGDAVIISVADTGRGMPPEVRDSLFTARAISSKKGGTGLGTKIVKDVVDAHNGRITVESTVRVGTTFLIRLPLRPPGSPAEPAKS